MACILKIPDENNKGVISFTTIERDRIIYRNKNIPPLIKALKDKWTVGLHHNYYDHHFEYDDLFDFSMVQNDLLIQTKDKKNDFPKVYSHALNFTPNIFHPTNNEKFWDIIHVSRAQKTKGVPDFFKIIKTLYDLGKLYKVLLICSVPEKNDFSNKNLIHNTRELYEKTFTKKEQEYFTFLSLDYNPPYPLGVDVISHFYKNSKILLNSGNDERHGRINAYAWACGMPVVALERMEEHLPANLVKEPIIYSSTSYEDLPELVSKALDYVDNHYNVNDFQEVINFSSEEYNKQKIIDNLQPFYSPINQRKSDPKYFNLNNLDKRIARHHGFGSSTNGVHWSIEELIKYLNNRTSEELLNDVTLEDMELEITKLPEYSLSTNDEVKLKMPLKKKIRNKIKKYLP